MEGGGDSCMASNGIACCDVSEVLFIDCWGLWCITVHRLQKLDFTF